jgi:hypothetical protein
MIPIESPRAQKLIKENDLIIPHISEVEEKKRPKFPLGNILTIPPQKKGDDSERVRNWTPSLTFSTVIQYRESPEPKQKEGRFILFLVCHSLMPVLAAAEPAGEAGSGIHFLK